MQSQHNRNVEALIARTLATALMVSFVVVGVTAESAAAYDTPAWLRRVNNGPQGAAGPSARLGSDRSGPSGTATPDSANDSEPTTIAPEAAVEAIPGATNPDPADRDPADRDVTGSAPNPDETTAAAPSTTAPDSGEGETPPLPTGITWTSDDVDLTQSFGGADRSASPQGATATDNADWLAHLNKIRRQSGLGEVSVNPAWDYGTNRHSCYVIFNGITHAEIPGQPCYTTEGEEAGKNSLVAIAGSGTTDSGFIDFWLTAPFHAILMLRPGLKQTSLGTYNTGGLTGATLDVLRGSSGDVPSEVVVFPGRDQATYLDRFIAESPDPRVPCGYSRPGVGLPLLVQFPNPISEGSGTVDVQINGPLPDGRTGSIDNCGLYKNKPDLSSTYSQFIGPNELIIMPSQILNSGRHTVTVTAGPQTVTWSFDVWARCADKQVTIIGTNADDTIRGTSGDDVIYAGPGNDFVDGGGGNDTICGASGNDRLYGGDGNDIIDGGDGNDRAYAGFGDDQAYGAAGDDVVHGDAGDDLTNGDGGDDYVYGDAGADTSHGGDDRDVVSGGDGNDTVTGGDGNDHLYGDTGDDAVRGGDGLDEVRGGSGNDVISGDDGPDFVYGELGEDTAAGGPGNDIVDGGDGNDIVAGDDGKDRVRGSSGDDRVDGGSGDDTVFGDDGNDTLYGGADTDWVLGGAGDDTVSGDDGDDFVFGLGGADEVSGGPGRDVVGGDQAMWWETKEYPDDGDDRVAGGEGPDTVVGGGGDDALDGGNGPDKLTGGPGYDRGDGGADDDTCDTEEKVSCEL